MRREDVLDRGAHVPLGGVGGHDAVAVEPGVEEHLGRLRRVRERHLPGVRLAQAREQPPRAVPHRAVGEPVERDRVAAVEDRRRVLVRLAAPRDGLEHLGPPDMSVLVEVEERERARVEVDPRVGIDSVIQSFGSSSPRRSRSARVESAT